MANLKKCADLLDEHQDFQALHRISAPDRYIDVDDDETIYLGVLTMVRVFVSVLLGGTMFGHMILYKIKPMMVVRLRY